MKPHWERGYRCHGYWLGNVRIGLVGLPPRPCKVSQYGYSWWCDRTYIGGTVSTLKLAKESIELEYRRSLCPNTPSA